MKTDTPDEAPPPLPVGTGGPDPWSLDAQRQRHQVMQSRETTSATPRFAIALIAFMLFFGLATSAAVFVMIASDAPPSQLESSP